MTDDPLDVGANDLNTEKFIAEMRARFIKEHMDCGATLEQAEQCYRDVMESECMIQLPSFEELDLWVEDTPEMRTDCCSPTGSNCLSLRIAAIDAELDAEYEREHQQHLEMLRVKYARPSVGDAAPPTISEEFIARHAHADDDPGENLSHLTPEEIVAKLSAEPSA
jgi:hypothetical protein